MKTRIQENKIWRYPWGMKVMVATMLVGLIFISAGSAASAQVAPRVGIPQAGLVNPLIARPVGLPIASTLVNPFSPIVRPFPLVNPFIRQLLLRQLFLNPFIDADDLGFGLGVGIGAGFGIGEVD
jgi:hypothetical protein